jgi:hypothetical protein
LQKQAEMTSIAQDQCLDPPRVALLAQAEPTASDGNRAERRGREIKIQVQQST